MIKNTNLHGIKAGDGIQEQRERHINSNQKLVQNSVHLCFVIYVNSFKTDDTHTISYHHAISLHTTLIELYRVIPQQTKLILHHIISHHTLMILNPTIIQKRLLIYHMNAH